MRAERRRLREEVGPCRAVEALDEAIHIVRDLEIPHLESLEEMGDDTVIH